MRFPKPAELLYVPAQIYVEAQIVRLTKPLISRAMGDAWWNDSALDSSKADVEIDRHWDWSVLEIEREGLIIPSRKLANITGDGAVQGALMCSIVPVPCEYERGKDALFVELLFSAPRNRHWIRRDAQEQFRGVGIQLLRVAAELSIEAGQQGRLKLESSPGFVDWYRKRGLLEISSNRIIHEGVEYTPMELPTNRVSILLPQLQKGP